MKQIPVSSQNRKYLCTCERPGRYGIALFFFFFFFCTEMCIFCMITKQQLLIVGEILVWSLWKMNVQPWKDLALSLTSMQATEWTPHTSDSCQKGGDLPIHRRGFMWRKPARGRMNCWFSLRLEFVTRLCLCLVCVRGLGCVCTFCVCVFLCFSFPSLIEEWWAVEVLSVILLHG